VAESKNKDVRPDAEAPAERTWVPTAEAKKKATTFRWIAAVLWLVAIVGEAVGIFWLLKQRVVTGADGTLVRDNDTGLLREEGVTTTFPQWAFITLLVLLVVIAALSITGSILWKKANHLDPAKKSVPLVILIFLNKDMDKGQKTTAGIVGIVLAALAVFIGVDFNPASVEKYTADQSTVIQLLGKDQVTWVAGGSVYHVCDQVSDIQTGSEIQTGTTAEAVAAHKERLTLKFASELEKCGLPVPENASEIADALRQIQGGTTVTLPAPVWGEGVKPPVEVKEAAPAAN